MSATNASAQPPKPEVSVDDASSSPVPSFSSSSSSSSSTASETNTSVTCSILSNLERLIADGLTDDNDEQASETGSQTLLPMLVAGLEESMQLVAEMKDGTTSAATTQNTTLSLMHRECVRDIASMMCGGDYPQWVEAQLMAQEEGDEEEEDEEDDEEREDTAKYRSIPHRNEDADDEPARRDTAECDLDARHGDAPTSPPQQLREANTSIATTTTNSTTHPAVPAPMKTETKAGEGQACNVAVKEEKEREEKSGPDMRALTECVAEQQHTKTWSFMMQQALEALQLSLPLQEKPREGGASSPTSVADTPVQQLARHLVSDAPQLWLRYLLVPMYAEWTQLRAHFSGLAQAQLRTAQAEHRTTPSATQLAGAETMRRLLCALCAAAHETALKNETVFADSMVSAVRALPTPPDDEAAQSLKKAATTNVSGAAALLAAQKRSKAQKMVKDVRRSQRRHIASLLCFSGTLARTAQSFTVIGSGGFTLVSVFAVRVMGHVRAAFAEWSRGRTAQEMSRDGPLRSVMSHQADVDGRDEAMPTCVDDAAVGGAERPVKRPRLDSDDNGNSHSQFVREGDGYKESSTSASRGVAGGDEQNVRASAAPSPAAAASDAKTCLADSLAALRVTLAVSAQQYATQLWHAWQLLFGFFGTDVYTDAALAQRLEEEAYAAAGVGHLSEAQQAQWRRLRHSSAVKQHTLSETHWLWCMCCLAQVRTSLLDDAIALHKVRDGSTAVVFRRVMMDALGIFFDAVRDSLVLYGQSLMASRAGGMPSANLIDAAALHHVLSNTLSVQPVFAHLLHDSCWWESEAEAAEVAELRRVVGVYVARVRPYLLRAQAPEEVSWMGSIASASAGATTRGGSSINTSGGGAMASSGGEDNSEALTRQFRREWERHWRSRAAVMSDVLRGTSARMETVLAEVEAGGDGSAQLRGEAHQKRRREGGDEMGDADGREGDADGHTDYAIQMKVFEEIISGDERREHRPVDRPKANNGTAASFSFSLPSPPPAPHSAQHPSNSSCSSHPLESVSTNFSSYYDATCFFLLRPERQRAFTRAVEKLCSLVDESAVPADGAMTQLFAHTLRQDTRLWMLLAHGTVLQLERRGRMAVEDEALLVNSLLPLLALLSSSSSSDTTNRKEVQCAHTRTKQTPNTVLTGDGAMMEHNADEGKEGDDAQGRSGDAPTWRQWTDLAMLHDLLLLVASGMLALPWSREGIYLTVHRHSTLCRLYGSRAGHTACSSTVSTQPSAFAAAASSAVEVRVSVMDVLRWFSLESTPTVRDAAARPEGGTTGGSSGATTASYRSAGAAMWTLAAPVGSHPHSPTSPTHLSQRPHRDFDGPAALTRVCERIDAMCRQQHPLFLSTLHTTGGDATTTQTPAVAPSASRGIADEGKAVANDSKREGELTDDAMERHLDAALRRHAHLMLTRTQCSAASGLLIVVAAYRSLSRALFSLRDAWEDQIRRMRDDDDGGGFAFRTATYCTSHDVTLFRWTLRVVHRCIFASQLQPAGLLRLWLGYLQHLFLCVVPPSASRLRDTSQSGGGGDEDTLRLMPISWQRSRRVSTLFGGRVHRTGWRALQHEVEPSSHTRLREELGTCLAELFVMPFEAHDEKEEDEEDDDEEEEEVKEGEKADAEASRRAARTSSLLQRTLPHLLLEMLCELLSISLSPADTESGQSTSHAPAGLSAGPSAEQAMAAAETQRMEAQGRAVEESCLGLAGLLAFLRRLELLVVPGSLQDQRLLFMLRRVYAAADAAAMGV